MDGKSLDLTQERIAQLRALFPDVFSEEKIDIQRLKQALGEDTFVQGEHYELSWAGKTEARKEIQKQTSATLNPKPSSLNQPYNHTSIQPYNNQPYNHTTTNTHTFIEGENLEVLRILQKSYFGKVKMIYIDPPYNTGNDSFVYPDDYTERQAEYNQRTGITNEQGFLNKQDLWRKNSKENGQFHSVWLSMMYPRLYLARNLMREDGVIFISIDDNEAANLKLLCDEVFGQENFVTIICHKSRASVSNDKIISQNHNHILFYARNQKLVFDNRQHFGLNPDLEGFELEDEHGKYKLVPVSAPGGSKKGNPFFEFLGVSGYYRFSKETMEQMYKDGLIVKSGETLQQKYYLEKAKQSRKTDTTWWDEKFYTSTATTRLNNLLGGDFFTNPKPIELLKRMLELINDKNATILDFFAGSGTTAQAVLELNEEDGGNRQFICVQMPEPIEADSEAHKAGYQTIADITQARIAKVVEKIEKERAGKLDFAQKPPIHVAHYALTPSNFKTWRTEFDTAEEIAQQLLEFIQPEKPNSTHTDMVAELCLKAGMGLNVPYTLENGYYKTTQGTWFCFEPYTEAHKTEALAGKPSMLYFLDSCFADDEQLANLQIELRDNQLKLSIIR